VDVVESPAPHAVNGEAKFEKEKRKKEN